MMAALVVAAALAPSGCATCRTTGAKEPTTMDVPSSPSAAKAAAAGAREKTEFLVARAGFLGGVWVHTHEGDIIEETWSTPTGDTMVGMLHWSSDGRARLFELMTISVEEPAAAASGGASEERTVVLRLRHFSRALEPWAKEKVAITLRYDARESGPGRARFVAPPPSSAEAGGDAGEAGSVRAITYTHAAGTLTCDIEFVPGPSGGGDPLSFTFQRSR